MPVQIQRRDSRPLLRQVNNKPYASSDDHEETSATPAMPVPAQEAETCDADAEKRRREEDAAVFADPVSSDDEPVAVVKETPPPSPSKYATNATRKNSAEGKIKANCANAAPARKSARNALKPPRPGTYAQGREKKGKLASDEEQEKDKENLSRPFRSAVAQKRSLEGVGASDEEQPKAIFGHLGYTNKKPRTGYTNIHARQKTYGSKKGVATFEGKAAGTSPAGPAGGYLRLTGLV